MNSLLLSNINLTVIHLQFFLNMIYNTANWYYVVSSEVSSVVDCRVILRDVVFGIVESVKGSL